MLVERSSGPGVGVMATESTMYSSGLSSKRGIVEGSLAVSGSSTSSPASRVGRASPVTVPQNWPVETYVSAVSVSVPSVGPVTVKLGTATRIDW